MYLQLNFVLCFVVSLNVIGQKLAINSFTVKINCDSVRRMMFLLEFYFNAIIACRINPLTVGWATSGSPVPLEDMPSGPLMGHLLIKWNLKEASHSKCANCGCITHQVKDKVEGRCLKLNSVKQQIDIRN